MHKEGRKEGQEFRSLEVRGKLIALIRKFRNQLTFSKDDFVCNNQPALQICIIMVHIYFCIDKNIALGNVLMMHWLTKILHWSVSFLAFDYSTAAKYL